MRDTMASTTIRIAKGTIVGRLLGLDQMQKITLAGDVCVEAIREPDGSWKYTLGGNDYLCASPKWQCVEQDVDDF